MVASISSNTASNWADSAFSKLDTKNQGYIEKTDLASALSATGKSDGSADSSAIDDMFSAIDGDSDGKVTKSELSEAVTKLSDQLNAQFDASRVAGAMAPPDGAAPPDSPPEDGDAAGGAGAAGATAAAGGAGGMQGAGGPRGGGGAGGAQASESTDSTSSTSTDYVAAADTDGDGTVSDAEQAAYDKKLASGEIDKNGNPTGDSDGNSGAGKAERPKDPMRELAHAMNLLKAYADSDASTASAGSGSGVSIEA